MKATTIHRLKDFNMVLCHIYNCHSQRLSDFAQLLFGEKLQMLIDIEKKINKTGGNTEHYQKLAKLLIYEILLVIENFILPEIIAQQDYLPEVEFYNALHEGNELKLLIETEN